MAPVLSGKTHLIQFVRKGKRRIELASLRSNGSSILTGCLAAIDLMIYDKISWPTVELAQICSLSSERHPPASVLDVVFARETERPGMGKNAICDQARLNRLGRKSTLNLRRQTPIGRKLSYHIHEATEGASPAGETGRESTTQSSTEAQRR